MPYQFTKERYLGSGSQGSVYEVKDKEGQLFAIKMCTPGLALRREEWIMKEMAKNPHPNIIRMIHSDLNRSSPYLVFELMDSDLHDYIVRNTLNTSKIKDFLRQILRGVVYLHEECRFVHRDLKSGNILVKDSRVLKIADFGLARAIGKPGRAYSPGVGAIWYSAPEIHLEDNTYSFPVDMWSIGCVFAEMVTREVLFKGDTNRVEDQLRAIFKIVGIPNEDTWPGVTTLPGFPDLGNLRPTGLAQAVRDLDRGGLDLLTKMLSLNPKNRISASDALAHDFLKRL